MWDNFGKRRDKETYNSNYSDHEENQITLSKMDTYPTSQLEFSSATAIPPQLITSTISKISRIVGGSKVSRSGRNMKTHRDFLCSSGMLLLTLLVFFFSCSVASDPLSQDLASKCTANQFKCDCGVPTCIDKSLVSNGDKDCSDGSDEGQWDPSKCAIKNRTSEDIRFKRAAIPDFSRMSNGDATTTFFSNDRARTRPVGLLSTSLGAFVTTGTTTEYLTKVLGTYIKGTYARIISTSSRVYHAVPTDVSGENIGGSGVRPTGFIASTTSTEINGYATTVHTTDYYRTYIDGTYAQLVSSSSNVQYPSWYTEQIDPSAIFPEITTSPTIISPSSASDHSASVYPTALPRELRGNFVNNVQQSKAYAELGIVNEENKNAAKLKALRPNNNAENELKVTGTHGKFIHSNKIVGDETTYNVFTGSYIQNSKTFLFFFGNTVIDPTRRVNVGAAQPTLMIENGPQKGNNLVVDMSQSLKVLVPSKNSRVMVDGSVGGQRMEGVVVEIEGSELGQDDLISVEGGKATKTLSTPIIDMITVTLDKNKQTRVSSTSSSSSSSAGRKDDDENEIPRGRKIPGTSSDSIRLIRPSRTEHVSLPTFTVGQPDKVEFQDEHSSTTPRVVVSVDRHVESSKGQSRGGAPVFQKVTQKPIPRSTERIRALGYTANKNTPRSSSSSSSSNSKYSAPNRNHRAFAGFDAHAKFNDVDSDLQSAASTGRATVTYVGFADFTTTVGNTVIVFMPRTKMIEDLSIHASKTETLQSPVVEPTRFVYQTDEETTTRRRVEDDDDEHVQFSVSQVQQARKVPGTSTRVTLNNEDEEETTTENINPSEPIRSVSGRQTIFVGKKQSSSSSEEIAPPEPTPVPKSLVPKVRPSASSSPASERRNSLFSSPRVKFTPKASRSSEPVSQTNDLSSPVFKSTSPSAYQTANTVVFQTDVLNPTGLVTSVDGTVVRDGKTTLYTSLVFGTFIGKSYAQVIKSTSKVVKSDPSRIISSPAFSSIRPTPVAKFSSRPSSSLAPVFTYEVTTTTEGSTDPDEEAETTTTQPLPKDLDRMEVSVSSTTESSNSNRRNKNKGNDFEDEGVTTVRPIDLQDSFDEEITTTTEKNVQDEFDNEVERRRKVQGKAKDQIIVDKDDSPLEATPAATPENEEEQTVYVTRTLPTTVFRTYTYYTTYFIPKEDTTLTSVVSREVTSSAVGLVRKTLTSIIPTASSSGDEDEVKPTKEIEKPSSTGKYKSSRGKVQASGAQVIYKTLFTTYTYLTTFFSGQTSSVSSREETVSNVITVTSGIGSKPTTSVKITPTGSSFLKSRSYKTASPRFSSASQGGKTNVGPSSSPQVPSPNQGRSSSFFRRPKLSSPVLSEPKSSSVEASATDVEYESVTKTLLRTFMTTYTYFTTLFNGDETSIKSRTEVITNVVPYVTKTLAPIVPTSASEEPIKATASASGTDQQDEEEYDDETDAEKAAKDEFSSSTAFRMSNNSKKLKETTFYTTYTYLSTIIRGKSSTIKTSKQTFTNVMIGDSTVRSGLIEPIEPTKLSGRSAGSGGSTKSPSLSSSDDDEDLNEVGSNLSEAQETTVRNNIKDEEEATTPGPHHGDYYELESSEGVGITTDRPGHGSSGDDSDDSNDLTNEKTPVLRTLYTTFTFYTTFYKGGTSTVSSRLETKSQIVTDTAGIPEDDDEVTVTDKAPLLSTIDPTYPVTYFTTYTYWTTSFKDGNSIVTSREETVTNVVTPGADDIAPSSSSAIKETENEILPTSSQEVELTTFYTTYTYFTTSYLGEKTIVNSRLETVTNVVTGTPTADSAVVSPTQTPRAIGTSKPEEQKVTTQEKDEYQDYDLPTGLLSTIVSSEVNDRTTTLFSTDVYGTYIDGIYAQVLESTSNVISPTATAETRFIQDATEKPTGVVSVNEGKTVEADGDKTTFYATTAYGTVINGKYAHLVESTSSTKVPSGATLEASEPEDSNRQKTGLVRIIDGTLVEGDHTTFYTSSILGTFIDGNYAQVIESTSRYVINPTKTGDDEITTVGPTKTVIDVESSITESPQEDEESFTTTTEKGSVEQEEEEVTEKPAKKGGIVPPKRFGNSRSGRNGTRLSFTGTSKTFTPAITPFASRSRPSGFVPRRRPSAAIIVTKTDDVTPTITATPSGSSAGRGGFQSRRRFQKPGDSTNGNNNNAPVGDGTTTPTPALPSSRTRGGSRFSKPAVGVGKSRFSTSSAAAISPTSAGGGASGSSPGARSRSAFNPRGSSVAGARGRGGSSSAGFVPPRPSSSAGFRGGASSSARFSPGRGRGSSISPSATQSTTPQPTQAPSLGPDEEEYEVEYEYETAQSSSTTTEAPKTTPNRFGSNNRFRLSPKLASPSAGTRSTTSRPSTTRGSPLNLRRFSKPTLPTRGTTPAASSSTAAPAAEGENIAEEYEEEYEEVSKEPSSTTTAKPVRPGFGKKPIITQRPTARPATRSRATTTGAPVAIQTTTRRIYTPRPRPAGFPRAVGPLTRSTTTTTQAPLAADEEYYEEDGDFEYQESKNHANVSAIAEASSELAEVRVKAPEVGNEASASLDQEKETKGDLLGSSSDLVETILQSIPITDNANTEVASSALDNTGTPSQPLVRRRRSASPSTLNHQKRFARSTRQVSYAYSDTPLYNYNYNFGARTARGTLRSNFPSRSSPSSSSNSGSYKSNTRSSGTNSNTDYDYEYYYDDSPAPQSAPPPTTAAPAPSRQSPSARFRGRIQPTSSSSANSNRRTPFTLTPNSNSNTRTSSRTRGSSISANNKPSSNSNSNNSPRAFIPTRRSQSRYQRPTEAPATTARTSRFRSRYNTRESATTPAPITRGSSNSRFGNTLTRGRGTSRDLIINNNEPVFEPSTITVTHYVPAETQIPFVNGKSTEYKTIVTPSPSIEVLAPHQYTLSDYLGKNVLVLHSEMTSTPSFGVTEVTRYVIRESATTSVTFTPTTIRGGGGEGSSNVQYMNGPLILSANATEQRVSGGRLFIQNARNLHTKVLNGVEVIVRGKKTGLIGIDKTHWLPHRVSPSKPTTLPAHTVSRQFHLVGKPGNQHNAIGHLLQSIVRSAIPDMVTKTMVTTFTYMTTILKRSNTVVKSREEVISNVMTQKFRPTIEYTPSLKSEPSTLPPELLASFMGSSKSYLTNTLTTTYIYYNTFTAGGVPVVLTSRETVSNVLTLPVYLSPTLSLLNKLSSSRVFETETYYSTYTFSKTITNPSQSTNRKVITTKETVTQVVVTEALLPLRSAEPPGIGAALLTPVPPVEAEEITKTYFTTFTHLFTEIGKNGQVIIRSSTSVSSETVTEKLEMDKTDGPEIAFTKTSILKTPTWDATNLKSSMLTTTIEQTKTLTPVLLYATKVYYTTYTYFTTIRNKDGTKKPPKVHSRTQVVSRVVTEALSTAFDVSYVNQLKSSYLSKHSILVDITSSVQEIIPTKTIDAIERPGTLVTQQVFHPHWPKDNDQLAFEVEKSTTTTESPIRKPDEKQNNNLYNKRHPPPVLQTPISSSEEHFDEVKEGVHKIVSVLTNTKITPEIESFLKPTRTHEYLYSTSALVPVHYSEPPSSAEPEAFVERVTLKQQLQDLADQDTTLPEVSTTEAEDIIITERPVTHIPTPPLVSNRYTTLSNRLTPTKTRKPIGDLNTELDLFPDIGPPKKSVIVDYPSDFVDYTDDFDDGTTRFGEASSDLDFRASTSLFGKRTGTIYFDGEQVSSPHPPGGLDPTSQILNLISDLTDGEAYDDIKDNSEEDIPPPKIYNIPTTFDTQKYSKEQAELAKLNKTLQAIRKKQNSRKPTTTTTPEPEVEEVTVQLKQEDEAVDTNNDDAEANNISPGDETIEAGNPLEEAEADENKDQVEAEENKDQVEAEENKDQVEAEENKDQVEGDENRDEVEVDEENKEEAENTVEADEASPTEVPEDIPEDATEKDDSELETTSADTEAISEANTDDAAVDSPPTTDDELQDDESDKVVFLTSTTTVRPKKQKTRYTTSKRPTKKTRRPPTEPPNQYSEEDSSEASTKIYALKPVRFSSGSGESVSEEEPEADVNDDNENKKDSEQDDGSSESYERRPADLFHGPGPSKSSISFPTVAGGTAIATAATSGINWKPLLNLGAIGLGGLGASTLTKLGPLFNSVAGYMKGALVPIARNDTQLNYHNSKKSQRGKRPYSRLPPKEAPVIQHSEPIYIPLGNKNQNENNQQNYRFSDERIPRRPVVTHANEPHFRPVGNDRDPDLIAGPLPPPIHHHFDINPDPHNFPPTHNYNFKPPNDNLPNIYTQMEDEISIHKHGDPPPPDHHPHPQNNQNNRNHHHPQNNQNNNRNQPHTHQNQNNADHHPPHNQNNNQQEASPNVIHIVPGKPGDHPHGNTGPHPTQMNPEGKTEFILKPLHNLINGRPMFDTPNHQNAFPMFDTPHVLQEGASRPPPPPQRPGIVTPVLRPTNQSPSKNQGEPQRPVYKPRPGPASIEMINEIKDSQRQPFDRQNPTIILPHRKPQNQNNGPDNRPPFLNVNNNPNKNRPGGQGPPNRPPNFNNGNRPPLIDHPEEHFPDKRPSWLPDNRFNENPFKNGNFNPSLPPELTELAAASHESFESHFSPDAQKPFFNHEGFVNQDHFNELISTPPPLRRPPHDIKNPGHPIDQNIQMHNPQNHMPGPPSPRRPPQFDQPGQGPQFDGPSPSLGHPIRVKGQPLHPEGEIQTSEESIYHPHSQNSGEHGKLNGIKDLPRPINNNNKPELILHPHNGQNARPFRPIPGSQEGPQRAPGPPPFDSKKNNHNSNGINNENGFQQRQRPNNRQQGQNSNGSPQRFLPGSSPPGRPSDHSDEIGNHKNSAENLFNHQNNVHSRPPGPPPHMPHWPPGGPNLGQNSGRFPGPMIHENPSGRFPGPLRPDPSRFPPGHPQQNSGRLPPAPRPPSPLPMPPLAKPTQHFPPFRQNPSTVYIVEELDNDNHEDDGHQNHNLDHELDHPDHADHHEESEEHHNLFNPPTTPHPEESSHEFHTQFPKLIIKEISTRPVVPYNRGTTTPVPYSNPSTNRALISKLFIRKFSSTTTPRPGRSTTSHEELESQTTPEPKRASSTSISRTLPPWVNKIRTTSTRTSTTTTEDNVESNPTLNDLLNFEDTFKSRYNPRRPNPNNRFEGKINITDKSLEDVHTEEYIDEMDEDKASSNLTISDHHLHPNHHPVHKPPIDVTKYLKDVGEDEFGQLYQGSEDQDTIIDPKNQKIIKSPYDTTNRRNISNFMRRSTTTTEISLAETTTSNTPTLRSSEEDEILKRFTIPKEIEFTSTPSGNSKLWWPTTFRPKHTASNEIFNKDTKKPFTENGPTTFRGDIMRPTTYRPGSIFNPMKDNDVVPPSSTSKKPISLRPAPQAGMASFYDDEDSMGQIKIKNSEIHKLPPFTRRPGSGIALVKPEEFDEYESSEDKKIRDKLNKEADKIKEYPEEYNEGDSVYDDDGSLEVPSGFPSTKLQPPSQSSPPAGQGTRGNILFQRPFPTTSRPGPFEKLTNLFRKPPVRNFTPEKFNPPGPPSNNNNNNNRPLPQPNRKPFIPQRRPPAPAPVSEPPSSIQIVRPQPSSSTSRPVIFPKFQDNKFNLKVKPIPLNLNIKPDEKVEKANDKNETDDTEEEESNGGEIKDDKINDVIPINDSKTTASSPQVVTKATSPPDTETEPTGNGHRESSYMYDSEYYEDDEEDNLDMKNNVIPAAQNLNGPSTPPPQPPKPVQNLNFQNQNQNRPPQGPASRPLPPGLHKPQPQTNGPPLTRPLNVGGHTNNNPQNTNNNGNNDNNNNGNRPPFQPNNNGPRFQPRPLPPRPQGSGFRIFESPRPLPPNSPKTEMEPPPIDSNRLKPPVLELPSSGPIRYKPSGPANANENINRPNLLRPDDDLFKPPGRRPTPSIHTIASVDDFNKIVGTNTFTAIFPSTSSSSSAEIEVKPTETVQNVVVEDNPPEVQLEGSEATVIIPSHSSGTNMRMSSVIKYTGGKLETSAVIENEIPVESSPNTTTSVVENIEPTKSSTTRLTIQRTRGPSGNVTVVPPTTTTTVSVSTSNSTSNSTNLRSQILLNRRPSLQIIRSTTTSTSKTTKGDEEEVSGSNESGQVAENTTVSTTTRPYVRRPFIPTRGPGPNIIPWARRTQSTTSRPVIKTNTPTPPSEGGPRNSSGTTTLRFSPNILNISRTAINRFDSRRPTSTLSSTSVKVDSSVKSGSDESKVGSSPEKRTEAFLKPTTFRPSFNRRPGFSRESSSSSEEKATSPTGSRFVPTRRPVTTTTSKPTTKPSIFGNVTTPSISSSPSGTSDSEYEEYSEEYEDDVTKKPTTTNNTIRNPSSAFTPGSREVTTSMTSSDVDGNQTVTVVTHVSSEINPTRVNGNFNSNNPRGGTRFRNTINLGKPGKPLSAESIEEDATTRYVTHTESMTVTITETETSILSSRGMHRTQTILITKTVPPQTLISTIVGTNTLVNSVDVKPTVVKTTIFSEPTKAVYTFVDTSESTDHEDEVSTEKVLLGGIITAGNRPRGTTKPTKGIGSSGAGLPKPEPSPSEPGGNIIKRPFSVDSGCRANCSLSANQACRTYANGTRTKCDCRPGYARMKTKYPCRPTFTYEMRISINHMDGMSFDFKDLYNAATDGYLNFITVTKEAIDKAFLATDIKRQFQGSEIIKLNPVKSQVPEPKVNVDFLVQLTTNITEDRIKNHLIRTLKAANFSVGRTGISSTREMADFSAKDFNECNHRQFHDCSSNADCINVRGSFTCKCKLGFKDKSSKRKPGRDCLETSGCQECNFRGTCHTNSKGDRLCHCFKWYGGVDCQINLKFLLIAITGIGSVLFILVMLCGTLVCKRSKPTRERPGSGRFMRYRSPTSQATMERTAIMNDSASSEGRQSPHPITHSFTPDSLLIDVDPKGPSVPGHPRNHSGMAGGIHGQPSAENVNLMNFSLRNVIMEQSDRSLSVMIPRAKIRPPSRPPSRHAAVGPDTTADLAATERKLISYLDHSQGSKPGPSEQSTIVRNDSSNSRFRKFSLQEQRKISQGALVSSGTEVSAIGGMRRRSTTGLEPDPTYTGYEKSVSEVRSFDETIRSPAKQQLYATDTSRTSCYSCKPPSYCAYSESAGHTMGDKDGASTVYTTQGKLFRMAHDHDQNDTSSTASSQ